jgi:hypothetical protein
MPDEKNDDVYNHSALEEAEEDFGGGPHDPNFRVPGTVEQWLRDKWSLLAWWWRNGELPPWRRK